MNLGTKAPPGSVYVVRRDVPPLQRSGPCVYITRVGAEVTAGAYTADLANARRWPHRAAAWRWLLRRQGRLGIDGRALSAAADGTQTELDPAWHLARVADRPAA